ncbi:SIS domain-containing protein [Alphaproteobacteria bacterium]|nr:SIS domain-containing protein [Alphaproteobacteria bacterium]
MIEFEGIYKQAINELEQLFDGLKIDELQRVVNLICSGDFDNIVGFGAGRMGFSLRAFIMRLSHIGFQAYMIGDTNFPKIGVRTLAIVNSSSGETPTSILYAEQAQREGASIIGITQNIESTLGRLSNQIIQYPLISSEQIMKTLPEQFTFILFDVLAEAIIKNSGESRAFITNNHSISE